MAGGWWEDPEAHSCCQLGHQTRRWALSRSVLPLQLGCAILVHLVL